MLVGSDYTVFSDEKNSSFFLIFQQDPCTVLVTCDRNMVQVFLCPTNITAFLYLSNIFKERAFQVQHFRLKLLAESTSKCVQKEALIFTEHTQNNMGIEMLYTSSDSYVKNMSKHFSKYICRTVLYIHVYHAIKYFVRINQDRCSIMSSRKL